jgi:hypothetical protein
MLFGKPMKQDWINIQFGLDGPPVVAKSKRLTAAQDTTADIEINPELPWSHQVGVVVGLLVSENQTALIEWMLEVNWHD